MSTCIHFSREKLNSYGIHKHCYACTFVNKTMQMRDFIFFIYLLRYDFMLFYNEFLFSSMSSHFLTHGQLNSVINTQHFRHCFICYSSDMYACVACGSQKKVQDPLELELQAVCQLHEVGSGNQIVSSGRIVSTPKGQAISSAPQFCFVQFGQV